MDIILLDWTRMGKSYCIAGAVLDGGSVRIVRPLLWRQREAPVRNTGWSGYYLDGHTRWEVFELIGPEPTPPEPPHVEDLWIRALRPRKRLATPEQRRAILSATGAAAGEPPFGAPWSLTFGSAQVAAGCGTRSLVSVVVPAAALQFSVTRQAGKPEADPRVRIDALGLEGRTLSVKDHFLLQRAEQAGADPIAQTRALADAVRAMGDKVVLRLGLTRPFASGAGRAAPACWVMADGFFSLTDPQP